MKTNDIIPKYVKPRLEFSQNDYVKIIKNKTGFRTFREFLKECCLITVQENGSLEDAIFIANDAFYNLSEIYG